ncbi:G-protein coupled receptor 54-like [Ptychodera flava]|uniref:G-protein coupled receptor 54-like n=1 Tax=Ptychodera flava TaxID=63121 RepID=UPI00396A072B
MMTNFTNYSDYYYLPRYPYRRPDYQIAVAAGFCFMALIGIMGNSAVVSIILKHRDMRSATNLYILNYAITDLAFLVICAPVTAKLYINPHWQTHEFFCKFSIYMQYASLQATCGTLTALTVDRCYVLTNPLKSIVSRTTWRVVMINCSIWIVSLTLHFPAFLFHKVVDGAEEFGSSGGQFCASKFPTDAGHTIYYTYLVVVSYLVPLVIISCCYYQILRRILQSTQSNGIVPYDPKETRKRQRRRKVIRMVLIMVSLFAICWAPLHGVNLWQIHTNDTSHPTVHIRTFALCLAYANSCVNPFVYAFSGRNYRTRFFAILRRQRTPPLHEFVNGNSPVILGGLTWAMWWN